MHKTAVLTIVGFCSLLVLLCIEFAAERVAIGTPRALPIATAMPEQIGQWTLVQTMKPDPEVMRKLPTARVLECIYEDPQARWVDFMLVTASNEEDLHDPNVCFPSQGYVLYNRTKTTYAGVPAFAMKAVRQGQALRVVYWFTGYYPPSPPKTVLGAAMAALRKSIMTKREGESLFVRVMAPDGLSESRSEDSFIMALQGPLTGLLQQGNALGPSHA